MDFDDLEKGDENINFIPCVKFVKRGVAKAVPEKLKLTAEELSTVISNTENKLKDHEEDSEDEIDKEEKGTAEDQNDKDSDQENQSPTNASKKKTTAEQEEMMDEDERLAKEYGLDDYDKDEESQEGTASNMFGVGELVTFANPKDDPYLKNPDKDDDASDAEDFEIRPTDNLILAGHVEGNAASLEVYVYNDVEDAFYVHHDLLLPSLPLAIEWLSYEPGEKVKGSLAAVGTMDPVIQVWDLDVVDLLEPAFVLGKKANKKKKTKRVGHKDAVLSLAWNHHVEHVMASGSVDQTVMLWDLSEGKVATTLSGHKEKVQALQWHPFEAQTLLTGCCDKVARIYDCRSEAVKAWRVQGEVEKVLWNHFDPFTCYVATESGHIQMLDVRNGEKPVWTLSAHESCINGLTLSTQCPDCLVSVGSDETLKVWDVAGGKPTCVHEKSMSMGQIVSMDSCPDAPFVIAVGGDKPSNNFRVLDVREFPTVRNRFGTRKLLNPLNASEFGYETLNDAEPAEAADGVNAAMESLDLDMADNEVKDEKKQKSSGGGAAGKFNKKKDKNGGKKKKNKNF